MARFGLDQEQVDAERHREFLLRPDLGRRLDEPSRAALRARAVRGADVQLIVADGLSAVACVATGKALHDAVARACATNPASLAIPCQFECKFATTASHSSNIESTVAW